MGERVSVAKTEKRFDSRTADSLTVGRVESIDYVHAWANVTQSVWRWAQQSHVKRRTPDVTTAKGVKR
jgi:hypothetical protein